MEKYIWRNCWS